MSSDGESVCSNMSVVNECMSDDDDYMGCDESQITFNEDTSKYENYAVIITIGVYFSLGCISHWGVFLIGVYFLLGCISHWGVFIIGVYFSLGCISLLVILNGFMYELGGILQLGCVSHWTYILGDEP